MTSYINTVIRTHVKNKERLSTLERMVQSWIDKQLYDLGTLTIVDDGSPMREELVRLVGKYQINYFPTYYAPDTKNGLAYSLLPFITLKKGPRLCCVDDAVFGKGIKDRLILLLEEELPKLDRWGIVGMFACYEDLTRNHNKVQGTDLWEVPNDILYALVGHVFSEDFAKIVTQRWEEVNTKQAEYPAMCDDIWVKQLLKEFNYKAYNTLSYDYLQHTGMNNRTFGESGENSSYQTKKFIGE